MAFEQIRDIVSDQLGVEKDRITMDSTFTGDLGADSLDMVELLMALEEKLGVHIEDDDAKTMKTVGDAVRYLEARS
ncbi:MAG: acyl carrier protein [Firmicutes bacterium]|jgi:acyl carrier protein|nr:acyl carrier protein [Bacillota bacterium]